MWTVLPVAASASIATAIAVGCAKGRQEQRVRPGQKSTRSGRPVAHGGTASSRASRKSHRSSSKSAKGNASAIKSSKSLKSARSSGKAGLAKPAPASGGSIKDAKTQSSRRSKRSSSSRSKRPIGSKGVAKSALSKKSSSSSGSKRSKRDKKVEVAGGAVAAVPVPKKVVIPVVPRMELKMDPKELHYKASGGMQNVAIVNTSDKRRAIKVKCSDNLLYRVNPVYAFVEPGESVRVDVLRQNGAPKVDKIVVVASEAEKEEADARVVCGRLGAHTEMMVLPLIAQGAQ